MKQLILIFTFLLAGQICFCQDKYGYYDYDSIALYTTSYKMDFKKIEAYQEMLNDSLNMLRKNLYNYIDKGMPHNVHTTDSIIKQVSDSLNALQNKVINYQIRIEKVLDDLIRSKREILRIAILKDIEKFRISNGISGLFDKKLELYHDDTLLNCNSFINYTSELINYINQVK